MMTNLQEPNPREIRTESGNYNEKIGRHYINAENVTIVETQQLCSDVTNTSNKPNETLVSISQKSEILDARATFVLTGTIDSINQKKLEAIVAHLRKLSGDIDLTILGIEEGSIKLTLKGSLEGLKRLEELFQSGELTEIEGMPVEAVQLLLTEGKEHKKNLKILVVDSHKVILAAITYWLSRQYPTAEILIAQTAQEALEKIESSQPDLSVLALSIPQDNLVEEAKVENGIQVLREVMQRYPTLNLTVQTSHVRALRRIKSQIDAHRGGFTIVDKKLLFSSEEMLARVHWALDGVTHTKDLHAMNRALTFRPEWLEVLKLAYQEGLQDKAIAERINVAPRTVLHYWVKIRDALGVYAEDGKNLRIQTEIRAREEGLID